MLIHYTLKTLERERRAKVSFIHLDFLLEPPAPRKSLSLLVERFRLSRLFDLNLCFRFDLSRSLARLRRTGDNDLLLLLERPILNVFEEFLKKENETFVNFMFFHSNRIVSR